MAIKLSKQIAILEGLQEMEKNNFPVNEALELLAENDEIAKYAQDIQEELIGGTEIPEAIDNANIFDDYIISIIKAAYESGDLANGYAQSKRLLVMEHKFRKAMKGVIIYPAVVLVIANISIFFVLIELVPKLKPIFKMLQGNLLVESYVWASQHIWVVFGINILIYILIYMAAKKGLLYQILAYTPRVNRIMKKRERAVFFNIMEVMYSANLPVRDILYHACISAGRFARHADLAFSIESSTLENFFTELYEDGLLDRVNLTKLVRSSRTGSMNSAIKEIAKSELEEYEEIQKNLTTVLQPIINALLIAAALAPIAPLYATIIAGVMGKYLK